MKSKEKNNKKKNLPTEKLGHLGSTGVAGEKETIFEILLLGAEAVGEEGAGLFII